MLGRWVFVVTYPTAANVLEAEFGAESIATVVVVRDGLGETTTGTYRVEFEREPQLDCVTFARILVDADERPLVLSRANFGLHNGAPGPGPFLRIDHEPYGSLTQAD